MSGHWARGYLGLAGADQNGGSGSGGGWSLVVHEVGDNPREMTLDKTWQEIYDALNSGSYVVLLEQWEEGTTQRPIQQAEFSDGNYLVYADRFTFASTSADGYPTISDTTGG